MIGREIALGPFTYFFKKEEKRMREKMLMKSVLDSYTFLNTVIRSIDNRVLITGTKSYSSYGLNDTLSVMNEVIDLTERKKKLITLKELIEESFENLSLKSSRIIVLKYLDKLSIAELAELFEVGKRTLQRLLDKAVEEVFQFFVSKGFNLLSLLSFLKDEQWIIGKYKERLCKRIILKKNKQKQKMAIVGDFC